jgi:hypothetical protein
MIDRNIEEGIDRYIKHVRKMSLLTDQQIKIMITSLYQSNPDSIGVIGANIDSYIENIRRMSTYNDDQLRSNLRNAVEKDPALKDVFEDASQKKLLSDMKNMAKDIHADGTKFARRVA